MRKYIVKSFEMLFGITVLCIGSTMGIIAGLGQTTSTATCSALSGALDIKVGTAMCLLYSFFLLLQLIILKKDFSVVRLLQLIPSVIQGIILNYFRYRFPPFQEVMLDSYLSKFMFFTAGMVLISLGFTSVKCSEFINYPPESFCTIVAERTGIRFGTCKIFLDFIYVVSTLILCYLAGLDFGIVREGTLIFAVFNGMLINLFMPKVKKLFSALECSS